ncbi:MAG: hypothetical protein KatS3mg110_3838 [Pirellulaceae bacterium]|nr:MAG: hypothetical protein KatS3mg110_3838 [Pirellulaceae bacterium]
MPKRNRNRLQFALSDLLVVMAIGAASGMMGHYLIRALDNPTRPNRVLLFVVVAAGPMVLLSAVAMLKALVTLYETPPGGSGRPNAPPHIEEENPGDNLPPGN